MKSTQFSILAGTALVFATRAELTAQPPTVRIDAGIASGVTGSTAGMRVFKGIPFR